MLHLIDEILDPLATLFLIGISAQILREVRRLNRCH
jgi:hypothetical protein